MYVPYALMMIIGLIAAPTYCISEKYAEVCDLDDLIIRISPDKMRDIAVTWEAAGDVSPLIIPIAIENLIIVVVSNQNEAQMDDTEEHSSCVFPEPSTEISDSIDDDQLAYFEKDQQDTVQETPLYIRFFGRIADITLGYYLKMQAALENLC
jgi:hypothetical protein